MKNLGAILSFAAFSLANGFGATLVDWNFGVLQGTRNDWTHLGPVANYNGGVVMDAFTEATSAPGVLLGNMLPGGNTPLNFQNSTANLQDNELNIVGWINGSDTAGWNGIDNWLYFSIIADSSYSLTIEKITFSGWRNGSGAPDTINFDYSLNGGSSWIQFGSPVTRSTTGLASNASADFLGNLAIDSTNGVLIRFAPYKGSAGTHTGNWHINALSVEGTITAIPETSTYAIGGGILLLGLGVLRRRRI